MDAPPPPARQQRNRKINTCMECRRLKRKCSRTHPCSHCLQTSRECVFPPVYPLTRGSSSSQGRSPASSSGVPTSNHAPLPPVQDGTSAWPDMCLRMGRMSITERIGGLQRATVLEELDTALERAYARDPSLRPNPGSDQFSATVAAWFKPHDLIPLGRLFTPPSKGPCADLITLSHEHQGLLIERFFLSVYPVCPLVSREDLYGTSPLVVPLRLAVFYAAAASLPLLDSQRLFGSPKLSLVRSLHDATTEALRQADSLNCSELIVFQATLIYLTPQFVDEVSRSHSICISAVIRHFQLAGHDRPPETDSEATRNLKRHLWHHLLFLNIRATEAVGPTGTLADDIAAEMPVARSPEEVVAVVRYECYGLHRWVFRERERVARRELSVEECFDVAERRVSDIRARLLDPLDHRVAIQKYANLVGTLLLARTMCMIAQGALGRKPQEIGGWDGRRTTSDLQYELCYRPIGPELDIVEVGILLDTDPDLAPWAWYAGAYHQYHSVLVPLVQICQNPELPNAERFLAAMDHVFGPRDPLSSVQGRATALVRAIADNLASFLAMTRVRAPERLQGSLEGLGVDDCGADLLGLGMESGWESLTVLPRGQVGEAYDPLSFDPLLLESLLSESNEHAGWMYEGDTSHQRQS